MRKRFGILIVILAVAILTGIGWRLLHQAERDPIYEGKRVSAWVDELIEWYPSPNRAFDGLIKDRSAEVVAFLIKALGTKDNVAYLIYARLYPHLPSVVKTRMPKWHHPESVRIAAARLLGEIPAGAEESVPALQKIAERDPKQQVRLSALKALAIIGPPAKRAVPLLITILQSNPDDNLRAAAVIGLQKIRPEAKEIVPVLVKALDDPFIGVRNWSAYALGMYATEASEAVGPLRKLASSTDEAAKCASAALKRIEPEAGVSATD